MGICISVKGNKVRNNELLKGRDSNELVVSPVSLNPNKIGKEYKIMKPIGIGSFGQVRLARHLKTSTE